MPKKKTNKKTESKKNIFLSTTPTGVKVISIIYFVSAVLSLLFGIVMAVSFFMPSQTYPNSALVKIVSAVMTVLFIGLAVLCFFAAKDLLKLKKWARKTIIVLSALGALGDILYILAFVTVLLTQALPSTALFIILIAVFAVLAAINIWIFWYLMFSKDAKKVFK